MFERDDDVLYVCYDNEAYMNTGVQRSGATPPAARTANTKPVGERAGQRLRPGQERAADRDGARDPVRRDGDRRRPARPRGEGRARDGAPRPALPPRLRPVPARLGRRAAATRSASRGSRRRRASSRSSRRSTARSSRVSKIRRQVPVEEYLRPQTPLRPPLRRPAAHRRRRAAPGDRRPQHPPLRPARGGGSR